MFELMPNHITGKRSEYFLNMNLHEYLSRNLTVLIEWRIAAVHSIRGIVSLSKILEAHPTVTMLITLAAALWDPSM